MTVTASAPGKLVLFGDHAAVYGKHCLVTAVDLRFSVTIAPASGPYVHIQTPELAPGYRVSFDQLDAHNRRETAFVEAALRQIYRHHPISTGLEIVTAGPRVTYGLGSSSAITVAALAAYAALAEIELSQRTLFDLAYAAVRDVQGKGSGVDVAAAVYGGTVYYAGFGEVIEPVAVERLPIAIGYSGAKVGTVSLIEHVAALRKRQPALIDPLLEMLGQISSAARAAIVQADWDTLGDLMNVHQGILDAFGVNTWPLARLIFAARDAGAHGAKLSGAGGGDCMFALISETTLQPVQAAIQQAGGTPVDLPNCAEGVRLENNVV